MGKSWDKTLPDIGIFKECFRVLKPGAFAFVMSAPRSDVCARMMLMLEDAGFEIGFTPIYWTYASGFPKAMNIGKMVDKRAGAQRDVATHTGHSPTPGTTTNICRKCGLSKGGSKGNCFCDKNGTPITPQAKALDGSYGGFQPKPAVEVVIVAMKPLSEKTYVDQALKNGKGITWLDDCRVPIEADEREVINNRSGGQTHGNEWQGAPKAREVGERFSSHQSGRFPADLIVSDDVLNDGKSYGGGYGYRGRSDGSDTGKQSDGWGTKNSGETVGYGDSGGYSRFFSLDAWYDKNAQADGFCVSHDFNKNCTTCLINKRDGKTRPISTLPFLIVPKASKREKNEGLDGEERDSMKWAGGNDMRGLAGKYPDGTPRPPQTSKNHHPTVKPLKLMSYLITLGSRPGDVVLDPFLGSGTTAIAAKQLGRQYIGVEREEEYVQIARARLEAVPDTLL